MNKNCIIYDVFHSNPYIGKNVWFERPDLEMNCPCVFNGAGDDNEIYAGTSASTGFVYRLDFSSTGADDTADITAQYQTKYFNAKTPRLVKRFPIIQVRYYLATGNILVYWYTNRGLTAGSFIIPISQTGTALGSFVLGTSTLSENVERTHIERLPDDCVGKDISLKFYHKGTGNPPIIRDAIIDWEGLYLDG